jgi:hypothetical protein
VVKITGAVIVISWRNILVAMIFMVGSTTCWSLNPQDADRFERAGEAYKQEKIQEAYQLYTEISQPTARVYFNLGNCAFKLNKFGRAFWHWRQAECRWGFFDREDLYQNLDLIQAKFAQTATGKPQVKTSKNFVERCARGVRAIPAWLTQFLFLVGWTLLFVFVKKLLKQKRRGLIVALFAWIIIFGGLLLYNQVHAFRPHAVVIESRVMLYSGPSTTYQQLGVLPEGSEVRVDKQRQDFCKITRKKLSGWIVRSALGFI